MDLVEFPKALKTSDPYQNKKGKYCLKMHLSMCYVKNIDKRSFTDGPIL
jgi:hypothetical protein